MVDIVDATVLVAVATLILALVTYTSVRQNRRQVDMLTRQTVILRSQIDPIPVVHLVAFNGNTLRVRITNHGAGPASSLAIDTGIHLCKVTFTKDASGKQPYSEEELRSAPKGTLAYPRYDWHPNSQLLDAGKKKYPVDVVNQLLKELPDTMILLPNEEYEYSVDLRFGLGNSRKDPDLWLGYEQLVETMRRSDVWSFALSLGLIGKNMADEKIRGQTLANFIVDLVRHKTLEDAFKENRRPYFLPLDIKEVAQKIPVSTEMYLQSKLGINSPKSFEEEK
jgi:hypothetical protein